MLIYILLLISLINPSFSDHSIEDYGAVAHDRSNEVGHKNVDAMIAAFNAANNDPDPNNRIVLLPSGKTFYFFNVSITGLLNVKLKIEGVFGCSNNITEWEGFLNITPIHINDEAHTSCLLIQNSINIELLGNGTIDGQGLDWWNFVYNTRIDHRPFLFRMIHCKNVEIHHISLKNPPFWTMDFVDMLDMHIHHIEVRVDPMNEPGKHPLNADGMDLRGKNILVEDVVIESGDDGISIKPTNSLGHQQNCSVVGVCFDEVGYEPYTNCSQDMVIRNAWIINSYGIAIGSIPPDPAVNCIKNITFENISEYYPLRGFYIKTNPGFEGSGIVDGITVRNMFTIGAEIELIYIGPAQSNQPGTNGSDCSPSYPFNLSAPCNTQPLVTISNILFQNITGIRTKQSPGVINCNKNNTCKNISFIDVHNLYSSSGNYWCANVEGIKMNSNGFPVDCLTEVEQIDTSTMTPKTSKTSTIFINKVSEQFTSLFVIFILMNFIYANFS